MDINFVNEVPVVGKWVVKYDDKYQMPQFVQGRIIGDTSTHKNGQVVVINDIESIDLKDKVVSTYGGVKYKLVGAGKRMILLNEGDLIEFKVQDKRKKQDNPLNNFLTNNDSDDDEE